jgi:hypothetical protein
MQVFTRNIADFIALAGVQVKAGPSTFATLATDASGVSCTTDSPYTDLFSTLLNRRVCPKSLTYHIARHNRFFNWFHD